jgi:hypothetical protein
MNHPISVHVLRMVANICRSFGAVDLFEQLRKHLEVLSLVWPLAKISLDNLDAHTTNEDFDVQANKHYLSQRKLGHTTDRKMMPEYPRLYSPTVLKDGMKKQQSNKGMHNTHTHQEVTATTAAVSACHNIPHGLPTAKVMSSTFGISGSNMNMGMNMGMNTGMGMDMLDMPEAPSIHNLVGHNNMQQSMTSHSGNGNLSNLKGSLMGMGGFGGVQDLDAREISLSQQQHHQYQAYLSQSQGGMSMGLPIASMVGGMGHGHAVDGDDHQLGMSATEAEMGADHVEMFDVDTDAYF